jgi:hypothetical protein
MVEPVTADRLRAEISRGNTGEKVDWPDPAMAPLGTDDEAAGTPPSAARVKMAHHAEIARRLAKARTHLQTLDAPTRVYLAFIVELAFVFILPALLSGRH